MEELVDGLGPDLGGRGAVQGGDVDLAGLAVEVLLQAEERSDVAVVAAPLDVEAGGGELPVATPGIEQDLVARFSRHHRRHVDRQAGALEELGAVVFLDGALLALLLMELEEEAPAVAGLDLAVERVEAAPVGGDADAR